VVLPTPPVAAILNPNDADIIMVKPNQTPEIYIVIDRETRQIATRLTSRSAHCSSSSPQRQFT